MEGRNKFYQSSEFLALNELEGNQYFDIEKTLEKYGLQFMQEFLELYNEVKTLKEKYINSTSERKKIFENELKGKLELLHRMTRKINNDVTQEYNKWLFSSINSNDHFIVINNEQLFRILLNVANADHEEYKIDQYDFTISRNTGGYMGEKEYNNSKENFMLLAPINVVNDFSFDKMITTHYIRKTINSLYKEGVTFVFTYDESYPYNYFEIPENNLYTFYSKSENHGNIHVVIQDEGTLATSIKKLISYAQKYGIDFESINEETLIKEIMRENLDGTQKILKNHQYICGLK